MKFWKDILYGDMTLRVSFLDLYSTASSKMLGCLMSEMVARAVVLLDNCMIGTWRRWINFFGGCLITPSVWALIL